MSFGKSLLFAVLSLFAHAAIAQNYDQQCEELKTLARESITNDDYKTASMYLLKAENTCGSLDKDNWDRLIGSLHNVINQANDETQKLLYIDTLLNAYSRQEAAGFYDEDSDILRGINILRSTNSDAAIADFYLQRGIKSQRGKTHESYLLYAYYATYLLFDCAEDEEKSALKLRMISDYLRYSEIADSAKMHKSTQAALSVYLDYVVESCNDLLPEVQDFIDSLPKEKITAINMIHGMTQLLENKDCENSQEYDNLIDTWLKLDSNSMHAYLKQQARMKIEVSYDYPPPMPPMGKTNDPKVKAKLHYEVACVQFSAGQYNAAYLSGKECMGEYKEKGLLIAAQCVAAMALSCGDTTFERKCNYLYAAQLAEEAGSPHIAENYRAKGPSSDCSSENKTSILLDCWGVTVYTCR